MSIRPRNLASGQSRPDLVLIVLVMTNVAFIESVFTQPVIAQQPDFGNGVKQLLQDRCMACHGNDLQSGSVDFAKISTQAVARENYPVWKKVVAQVSTGSMPPETEKPLTADEKQRLLQWVGETFDTRQNPDPGPPLTRQLTRHEYGQTLRDLLRFWFDPTHEAGIPDESVVEGFANRAGGLVLESSLMEKYFTAADLALEKLFTDNGAVGARKRLLFVTPSDTVPAASAVRQVVQSFLRRAFRRPVAYDEVEKYSVIADRSLAAGEGFEMAIRKTLKPALVSPHFLLRVESQPGEAASVHRVNDHELAVRLSYFLWSSMPDDILFEAADRGDLSKPDLLEQQVRRMLAHGKAEALTSQFLTHWLQLPHLRKALPSQNQFPTYTRSLRDAMERETWLFCDHLRKEDRSVLELLDADYTFVNAELARHYQLAEIPPKDKDFQKVQLKPEDHRGGVIGMSSILTMTSHTDRTKPTARGKWMLEVLLGEPPPPPPANAGSFAPPEKDRPEPKSFREKLAQHATNANCIGCHKRVDPFGFALENYDAIGSWRDESSGATIDNVGQLPGVGEFRGVEGLRRMLRSKQSQIVSNLAAQTLSYALGRDVSYYDEPSIAAITRALERDEYRFSTLILQVVNSHPFLHRRATTAP